MAERLFLQVSGHQVGCGPLLHGICPAAIEAARHVESCATAGAGRAGLKGVEGTVTLVARPEIAEGRLGVTSGAEKALATGKLRDRQQCARVL